MRIFISGPSGVGKSTIIRELLKRNKDLILSVSYTTRPPRPREVDGKDYFFISRQAFKDMQQKQMFLECACVHDHLYGTSLPWVKTKEDQGFSVLFDIDVQGVMMVKKSSDIGCFIFIVPPSLEELSKRLQKRGTEASKDFTLRLKNATTELGYWENYDYIVVNDKLERAIDDAQSIINAYRCSRKQAIKGLKWLREIG
ncbi:MAG: guanylate kinase [Deltaproteobacteria bacterium]|nr:guanylate kinase [Deltaproteobacteria bacterium]